MLNKIAIYERFAVCHSAVRSAQLAKIYGVSRSTANRWKSGINPIPLEYLKQAVDKYCVSWDWLMDGKVPQYQQERRGKRPKALNRHAINKRFLSLFPGISQARIAGELGVKQTSVYRWRHDMAQVARECLKYAVDNKEVTWDWLLEGR